MIRRPAVVLIALVTFAPVLSPPVWASHSAYHVVNSGWDLWWGFTQTDGLHVRDALFNGRRVFWSGISTPQIIPKYVCCNYQYYDQLGNGPVEGPSNTYSIPYLPGSAQVLALGDGFEIRATYPQWDPLPVACRYRYVVRYRFHVTGSFEPWVEIHGPGCEEAGAVYYVYWRIDYDIEGGLGFDLTPSITPISTRSIM